MPRRGLNWEYDHEAGGFVRGRATMPIGPAWPSPPPPPHEGEHAAHTGLFDLHGFADLVALRHATVGDVVSEVSLFSARDHAALVRALTTQDRPRLAEVLGPDDVFAHVVIGEDAPYEDAIVVAAHTDMSPRLAAVCADLERRVAEYEAVAPTLPDIPAFLDAMGRVVSGR